MTDRRHAQRRVAHAPHPPERRGPERRHCIGCGVEIPWRSTAWCSPRCRVRYYCDHPTLRPACHAASVEARIVAVIEAKFAAAKLALRRASSFTVDGWAQRPGAGRGMEDWGHEE